MTNYIGIHWYKCDLHLHTMSSECYLDKNDTPEAWIARAKAQGLDCVAVTDHNDYRSIDACMEEGKKQGVAVFPGVEITCDSTKIHLLVIFDTSKNGNTVRDFLSRCDIDSEEIGNPDGTSMSAFEVCRAAKKKGAMVIAAHIDEFSSISSMNPANLDKILSPEYLDGVQTANKPLWEKYKKDKDADAMVAALQAHYGPDATPEECERWRKCYERALAAGIPMIAASDNPAAPEESKHGLWGIGTVYTWIKMNDVVDLESILQSLVSPDTRIRTCFDSPLVPYEEPDFWIQSVDFRKTALNPHQPIHLDFSPQLNCIIGGRGSGKSAVVQLISGAYRCLEGTGLSACLEEMQRFYHACEEETGIGVFLPESEIEIGFRGFARDWKLMITDIRDGRHQNARLLRRVEESGEWEEVPDAYYHDLFRADVFVENQIYELARTPAALLGLTDRGSHELQEKLRYCDLLKERWLSLRMELRTVRHELDDETRRESARKDYADRIKRLENTPGHELSDITRSRLASLRKTYDSLAKEPQLGPQLSETAHGLEERCEKALTDYEDCRRAVSALRSSYIEQVLGGEENIRMEAAPCSDRASFESLMRRILPGSFELWQEDIRLLAEKLFAKKNGIASYRKALLALRNEDPESGGWSARFRAFVSGLDDTAFDRLYLFIPEDELKVFFRPNGIKRFFPISAASSGQRAIAVLTLIMAQGSVPLIMDQPEDDLDNRLIYEMVVRDLKRIKENRQLILVTHNANIPVNADAELIISMDPWAKFTRVRLTGTMDEEDIRHEICDVLEGSDTAFSQRARKYHLS